MTITTRRNALFGGVALAAGLAGVGLAWRRDPAHDAPGLDLAPLWDAEFETPGGDTLNMAAFKGQGLVVNFWATWCPPCVEEIPLLDRFFQENQSKGWQVVGLAIDQPSKVKQFLTQMPIGYPVGLAGMSGGPLSRALGNPDGALPYTLVITPQGRVQQQKLGKLSADDVRGWV